MRKLLTIKITGNFILSSAWALLILTVCIIPANKVQRTLLSNIKHMDKYFHFVVYLIFSLILYTDFHKYRRKPKNRYFTLIIISVITLCWGIMIELVQYFFLINRKGSVADVLVNTGGIITGIVLILTARKYALKI